MSSDVKDMNLEQMLGHARTIKARAWELSPKACDLGSVLMAWENSRPLLIAFPDTREEMQVSMLLLATMTEELLVHVADSYSCHSETKIDGSAWEHGEMQEAWANNTPDKALLSEAIVVTVWDRQGGCTGIEQDYVVTPEGIAWTEKMHEPKLGLEGVMPDMGRTAMSRPSMNALVKEMGIDVEKIGLSPSARKAHMLCAAVKTLAQAKIECAVGITDDEEMMAVVTESLAELNPIPTIFG